MLCISLSSRNPHLTTELLQEGFSDLSGIVLGNASPNVYKIYEGMRFCVFDYAYAHSGGDVLIIIGYIDRIMLTEGQSLNFSQPAQRTKRRG